MSQPYSSVTFFSSSFPPQAAVLPSSSCCFYLHIITRTSRVVIKALVKHNRTVQSHFLVKTCLLYILYCCLCVCVCLHVYGYLITAIAFSDLCNTKILPIFCLQNVIPHLLDQPCHLICPFISSNTQTHTPKVSLVVPTVCSGAISASYCNKRLALLS